jgi:hypothetical protein
LRELRWIGAVFFLLCALGTADARALNLQPIGIFDQPIYVTSDPGDPNRLFVVEREGAIKLVRDGNVSTFVDLSPVVRCCDGERGLSSMALAPDFGATGKLYVVYTGEDGPGNIHVDELTATGDFADPLNKRSVLTIPHSASNAHHGGQLQFGPDGYLYISTGDGAGGNDPLHHAQDLDSQLGKILRINPKPSPPLHYTVPAGNPFSGSDEAETIWNLGLRNPFRFSFDRLSGGMAIGDVGQDAREEIDWAPSPAPGVVGGVGANYGWSCREGLLGGLGDDPACVGRDPADFVDPVFDYPHDDPGSGTAFGCSVIGGYVVRDPSLGDLYGRYVYTDFCTGGIRSLLLPAAAGMSAVGDRSEGITVSKPVSFGEDSIGRIYLALNTGGVYRLCGQLTIGCPAQQEIEERHPTPLVGIKAERRRVERGKPALITAWLSPCEGREGQLLRLLRGGRPNGSKYLSRACTVRFHPRIRHRTTFKATFLSEKDGSLLAESRRLTIKIDHRRR